MASFDAWIGFVPRHWARDCLRRLGLVMGAAALALAVQARAESVPDLYAVSVPVAEQSQAELQRAAAVGLRELAVRISGRSSAASDPNLAPVFASASRYLDQFRYERSPGGDASWLAQLRFAPVQVDSELRKAGLPVWGGNRPALQVMLAIEDKGVRTVIDDNSALANVLREQWRRRGLVLHLPSHVNSINSANAVNIDDVLRLDAAKVGANLQERVDGLVLGRIALASDGVCASRWGLTLGTQGASAQSFTAEANGSGVATCVATALDRLVDSFSAQYAIAANSSAEGLVLRVNGVVSFEDYAALLNYLRRLAVIKNVQPVFARGDELLLQLKVEGSAEQLARQFALESRLAPVEAAANTPLPVTLNYRWAAARN